jgi:CcmD family protein
MIKRIISTFLLLTAQLFVFAQDDTKGAEMADTMRSNGKIYVVVAVILVIFAGILLYLIRLDRKITKLERNK